MKSDLDNDPLNLSFLFPAGEGVTFSAKQIYQVESRMPLGAQSFLKCIVLSWLE